MLFWYPKLLRLAAAVHVQGRMDGGGFDLPLSPYRTDPTLEKPEVPASGTPIVNYVYSLVSYTYLGTCTTLSRSFKLLDIVNW